VQALLFGLLHPVGIRGWVYTFYTLVVGLLLGYATMVTGSVWPAVLTHAVVNGVGLYRIWRERPAPPRG
jgi:membrane protease YdiL (CAAX protease family)